jgi:hypothetical protein
MQDHLHTLLLGTFLGMIAGALITRLIIDRQLKAIRRHTRRTTWQDCVRFHQFRKD